MNTSDALKSLRSTTCPACHRHKKSKQSFCGSCYFALSQEMRGRLWLKIGAGYEEAMAEALGILASRPAATPTGKEILRKAEATLSLFQALVEEARG